MEWTNETKFCKNFFCRGNFIPFLRKRFKIWDHFFPLLFLKDSENQKSLDNGLWEVGAKRPLNGVRNINTKKTLLSKAIFTQKQYFFVRQFYTLYYLKISNLRPLLSSTFPLGFRIEIFFGHPTLGYGGKKTFKRYLNSERTHRQTHTHIWTNRLIKSIGPLLSITFPQGFRISKHFGHPILG